MKRGRCSCGGEARPLAEMRRAAARLVEDAQEGQAQSAAATDQKDPNFRHSEVFRALGAYDARADRLVRELPALVEELAGLAPRCAACALRHSIGGGQ